MCSTTVSWCTNLWEGEKCPFLRNCARTGLLEPEKLQKYTNATSRLILILILIYYLTSLEWMMFVGARNKAQKTGATSFSTTTLSLRMHEPILKSINCLLDTATTSLRSHGQPFVFIPTRVVTYRRTGMFRRSQSRCRCGDCGYTGAGHPV